MNFNTDIERSLNETYPIEHGAYLVFRYAVVHEIHEPDAFERVNHGSRDVFSGGAVQERSKIEHSDPVGISEHC